MASYTTAVRTAQNAEVAAAIDADTDPGEVKVYAGSVPANVGASIGGATLLVTCVLSSPPLASNTGGVATFDTIAQGTIVASGTATFARITDGDDNAVVQLTAGEVAEELVFDDADLIQGGTVDITSMAFTAGNA